MSEGNQLIFLSAGVQTRWTIEAETPYPPSFKSLPNQVIQARARDAWKAAGRLKFLVDLWSNFLVLGELRARLDPNLARHILEKFPTLGNIDTILDAIASTEQFPEEVRTKLVEFDREFGLRRERDQAEGQPKPDRLRARDFEGLRRTVGKLLEAEAACLHGLDVNIEQFRRPWKMIRQEIQGFIGIDEDWAANPPKIEFGLALKGEGFQRGRASLLSGIEQLRQMLHNYPETALERASQDKAAKPGRPSRGALPGDEANVQVREYLQRHHHATSKMIAEAIGCSESQVRKTPSWKAVSQERLKRKKRNVRSGDCSEKDYEKAELNIAWEHYQEDEDARLESLDGQESPAQAKTISPERTTEDRPSVARSKSREEELAELIEEGKKMDAADNRQRYRNRRR